jgi:hypothetical protein
MPTRKNDIAAINDKFRKDPLPNGKLMLTRGVADKGDEFALKAVDAVKNFNSFAKGNDPYAEHDFGAFELDGEKLFWKIDYYDRSMEFGSADPTDETLTIRVLTVMLAEEYRYSFWPHVCGAAFLHDTLIAAGRL